MPLSEDRRIIAAVVLVVASAALPACGGDDGAILVVDLRTDFALGPELHTLELYDVKSPGVVFARVEPRDGDPLEGVRVLELEGVPPGVYHLVAVGWRPDGSSLARTEVITGVRGNTSVRLLLTRDCADVRCPESDPVRSACLGGSCEDPRCIGGEIDACVAEPECTSTSDCGGSPLACGELTCMDGWCVVDVAGAGCGDGQYCKPESGCMVDSTTVDSGMPVGDAGIAADGGTVADDGGTADAGAALDGSASGVDGGGTGGGDAVTDPACRDGVRNGGETGVDCGGPCAPCADAICPVQSDVSQAECLALVALHQTTGGADWRDATGWMTPTSPCTWSGVTCTAGSVTALDLSMRRLRGELPAALGNLRGLVALHLHNNALSGALPPEIGHLTALVELDLHNNALSGSLPPEIGDLSSLERLDMQSNALTGPLPSEIGALGSLLQLDLQYNAIAGPLPAALGDLARLEYAWLRGNAIDGPLPASLGRLDNLIDLWMQDNSLEGPIPAEMGGMARLNTLYLDHNNLGGEIPVDFLGLQDSLTNLTLNNNNCLTSSSTELTGFLVSVSTAWNLPNGTVPCP